MCWFFALSAWCVGCSGKLQDGKSVHRKSVSTHMTFADTPTPLERKALQVQASKLNQTLTKDQKQVNEASKVFESTSGFLNSPQ